MILKGGTVVVSGLPLDLAKYKTENKITDEKIVALLAVSIDD